MIATDGEISSEKVGERRALRERSSTGELPQLLAPLEIRHAVVDLDCPGILTVLRNWRATRVSSGGLSRPTRGRPGLTDDNLGDGAVLLDWKEAHIPVQLDAEAVGERGEARGAVSVKLSIRQPLRAERSDSHVAVEFERVHRLCLLVLQLLL